MSKVEKYSKQNLIVAEKAIVVAEKEIIPIANVSSDYRHKKSDRRRDDESTKDCYGCGSVKHLLRDCPRRQEFYGRRREREDQHPEASHKRSMDCPDSPHPHLKSILRRKPGDEVASNKKFKRPSMNQEGNCNSDKI